MAVALAATPPPALCSTTGACTLTGAEPTRVAIAFFGATRHISFSYPSLVANLLDAAPPHDIFTHEMSSDATSTTPEDLAARASLAARVCRCASDSQAAVDARFSFEARANASFDALPPEWKRVYDVFAGGNGASTLSNIYNSRFSLLRVSELVQEYQHERGFFYTHVIAARPDVKYLSRLVWAPLPGGGVRVPNHAHYGGICDRFAYGDNSSMLQGYMREIAPGSRMASSRLLPELESEQMLCGHLIAAGTRVALTPLCLGRLSANAETLADMALNHRARPSLRCLGNGLNFVSGSDADDHRDDCPEASLDLPTVRRAAASTSAGEAAGSAGDLAEQLLLFDLVRPGDRLLALLPAESPGEAAASSRTALALAVARAGPHGQVALAAAAGAVDAVDGAAALSLAEASTRQWDLVLALDAAALVDALAAPTHGLTLAPTRALVLRGAGDAAGADAAQALEALGFDRVVCTAPSRASAADCSSATYARAADPLSPQSLRIKPCCADPGCAFGVLGTRAAAFPGVFRVWGMPQGGMFGHSRTGDNATCFLDDFDGAATESAFRPSKRGQGRSARRASLLDLGRALQPEAD